MKPLRFSPRIIVATVVAAVVSLGGLSLAYGGPLAKTWRGHGHSSKALLPETCGKFLRGAEDVIAAGGIPVAFHWVLALFLLVLSRNTTDREHAR